MRSMTGYGRGTCEVGGRRLVVELRSLNHRFLEVKLRLPWSDPAVEAHLTQLLRSKLDRVVVSVSVRDEGGGGTDEVRADLELARSYAEALTKIRDVLETAEPISLALIAAQPGVLTVGEPLRDGEELWAALKPGVEAAVAALGESREREGGALQVDLQTRAATLDKLAVELRELTRDAPDQYRRRLRERLDRALQPGDAPIDAQRLTQEVAFLADKADVAEELTRLETHLAELKRLLGQSGPSGRRLDFLTQELNREVNTIGSKANDAVISREVVTLKAELEKFREQAQNVE